MHQWTSRANHGAIAADARRDWSKTASGRLDATASICSSNKERSTITYRPSRLRSRNSMQQALARIEASLKTLTSDFRRPACPPFQILAIGPAVRQSPDRCQPALGCAIAVVVSRQIHFRLGDGGDGVPWNHGIQAMSLTHASRMSTKKN
jgi:hypothetical protein